MFTSYIGNFEDGSLEITCEDLFPMDLGSGTYTEFKMDEAVAVYMAQNPELFDCDLNLIHSHNQMQCFFSGTDCSTLQSEGNDQNCFVSLIVNNAGTYCAAITRKVQRKKETTVIDLGSSYEFFGEGSKVLGNSAEKSSSITNDVIIEYFMLDVDIEPVDNPLAYLDDRFDAIEAKKKSFYQFTPKMPNLPTSRIVNPQWDENGALVNQRANFGSDYDKDKENISFREWLNKPKDSEEPTLFSEEEMGDIDPTKWQPDPTVIHRMVIYLITCSFITNDSIDLKQWIHSHMVKKYDQIFFDESMFTEWKDFIIEFLINHYSCLLNIPDEIIDEYDTWQSKIAEAIVDELGEYPTNGYIDQYVNHLMEYLTVVQ